MKVVLSEMEKEIIQEIGHNKLTADFVEAQLNSKANIFVNLEEGLEKKYMLRAFTRQLREKQNREE